MSKFAEAYRLVESLYDNGDLSHDQAAPLLKALDNAYAMESDYGNLIYFYKQAQELRYLMRAVIDAKAGKHDEMVQRADRQWAVVRDILGQLALDEQHPGRAGGNRPTLKADER
jgi:hypothetical protein